LDEDAKRFSCRLEGTPAAIGIARDRAERFLVSRATVPAAMIADALLAVSELVTNAVRHAPGPCELEVVWDGGQIHVSVSDTSRAEPRMRIALPDGSGGFGLRMLRALGGEVQTRQHAHGKTVSVYLSRATG
jgi:anti-sigma regulatory factor (Ser/Thr protein kinase)